MESKRQRVQIRVDAYTRVCLTVIAGLLTVLVIGLWAEVASPARDAKAADNTSANSPYVGAQRQAQVRAADGIEETTGVLKQLVRLFETGQAKVQVTDAPEKAGKQDAAAPAKE